MKASDERFSETRMASTAAGVLMLSYLALPGVFFLPFSLIFGPSNRWPPPLFMAVSSAVRPLYAIGDVVPAYRHFIEWQFSFLPTF